ncbi:hypothetical protein [Amantichitinum ursilacus]|uniref:hypothetical protein n=1 Tax=Amantichitinum ursilacus TaxID=857265 RepID=UPI00128EA03C|nr:hypothetical protein [Amantichitinum ursilacus]
MKPIITYVVQYRSETEAKAAAQKHIDNGEEPQVIVSFPDPDANNDRPGLRLEQVWDYPTATWVSKGRERATYEALGV